ncbi:MAG: DUF3576 domain-containing protein [Alphaproteobacteria bacterium]|jgi:hypothetical protein
MKRHLVSVLFVASVLAGCGSDPEKPKPTVDIEPPPAPAEKAEKGDTGIFSWFGGGGGSSSGLRPEDRKGVAVNAYLWRASLDTLAFMPMEQTDPFGGVIKTGWWVPPSTPNERIRVFVAILDTRLRAEALRVTVFKEMKRPTGEWEATSSLDPETVTKLENIILNKARAMKIQDE